MKLTTKGRFAVTAMVDLALHEEEAPISLTQISERQQISVAYLEQIFCKLRRAGLVASVRGPGGGYRLGAPAGPPRQAGRVRRHSGAKARLRRRLSAEAQKSPL